MTYGNDIDLIWSLKNGKSKAFDHIVDVYHHRLCIYAYSLSRDHDLSEDIVQNVYVFLWRNRLKLKDHFSIKNYLYKSVYNEFIDQYRKQRSVTELEKRYVYSLDHIVEVEDDSVLEKQRILFNNAIEKLPPKCKQAFLLSKQEGLTNLEISEHLNISVKAVEAHITKAFFNLKNIINENAKRFLLFLFHKLYK